MEDLPCFHSEVEEVECHSPRRASRDSMLLCATLECKDGRHRTTVRVRNISASGLMFEADEAFRSGEAVAVTLRGVGRVTGHIVWREHDRMGMAFDEPIDPLLTRKPITPRTPVAPATVFKRPPTVRIG